ncbi:MAG TPA: MBL fold metallo-hydrolase, partial [Rikenellaceae bacterium]|nr:MBL fold metallo-hydrolase [Rikenellaceae bacterium]
MLKFLSLSSGSCGNCYFLSDGKSGLLIDAGVSQRRLKKTLM